MPQAEASSAERAVLTLARTANQNEIRLPSGICHGAGPRQNRISEAPALPWR
jgi:hypothetical protein